MPNSFIIFAVHMVEYQSHGLVDKYSITELGLRSSQLFFIFPQNKCFCLYGLPFSFFFLPFPFLCKTYLLKIYFLLFNCVGEGCVHVSAVTKGHQYLYSWLQPVVSCLTRVLGTELRSFGRAVGHPLSPMKFIY